MKIFVFAVGGTGARILKAITFMLASGLQLKNVESVIPLIVDFDAKNGDTKRTLEILDLYYKIRSKSIPENIEGSFFKTKLGTLGDDSINDGLGSNHNSFQIDFSEVKDTFFQYLKADQLNDISKDLLNLLFDNSPKESSKTELNLELRKGLKGNPNIGSIIFNHFLNTKEFEYFERIFGPNDRIFLVNSIFGGTGTSGFYQLVKNFRISDNAYIKKAKIGACTVLPYFNVEEDTESAVDPRNFNSKTKAALSFYSTELNKVIDHIYYVGDKPGNYVYENHDGGLYQKNPSHVVELIAGLSFINFANFNTDNFVDGQTSYFEYGIKNDSLNLDFTDFHEDTRNLKFESLTQFTFFSKLVRDHISETFSKTFSKNLNLQQDFSHDSFYIDLKKFVSCFFDWLDEMSNNSRSFSPFNLSKDDAFNAMIKQKAVKGLDKSLFKDFFTSKLSEYQKEIKKENIKSNYEQFMRIFYKACEVALKEKVKSLPSS